MCNDLRLRVLPWAATNHADEVKLLGTTLNHPDLSLAAGLIPMQRDAALRTIGWRHSRGSSDGYLNLMLVAVVDQGDRVLVKRQRDTVED